MRKELRIFTIATSLVLGTITATAQAPHYTNLYVFGDSYYDVGNLYAAFGRPGPPYYDGRLSNGPIWVDHIAGFLGLPLTPSLILLRRSPKDLAARFRPAPLGPAIFVFLLVRI